MRKNEEMHYHTNGGSSYGKIPDMDMFLSRHIWRQMTSLELGNRDRHNVTDIDDLYNLLIMARYGESIFECDSSFFLDNCC